MFNQVVKTNKKVGKMYEIIRIATLKRQKIYETGFQEEQL